MQSPSLTTSTAENYNYFRDYDPATGRYAESDPIGLKGGSNTFAYVGAGPLESSDPFGLMGHGHGPGKYPPGWGPGTFRGPFGPVCGSGPSAPWIPDGLWESACAIHDKCYETCGRTKMQCDLEFLKNSGNVAYYSAVLLFGEAAYRKAQAHCPQCEPVSRPPLTSPFLEPPVY